MAWTSAPGGREPGSDLLRAVSNEMVKRLTWSGLLAGLGALASVAVQRLATTIWRRVYGEDPPE